MTSPKAIDGNNLPNQAYNQAVSLKDDLEKRTGYVHIILDHPKGYAVQKTTTKKGESIEA